MYLKFAEDVDILVQIVYAKFENERGRTVGMPGAQNGDKHFKTFLRKLFQQHVFHCCVQFKDTGTDCQGYWYQYLVFNLKM